MKLYYLAFAGLLAVASTAPAKAEPFQSSDRINLYINSDPGGSYDTYGRFVARFLGKHLTNGPSIVAQNMPGAGGLRSANYLYNIAPKDGTAIGTINQSVAMMQMLEMPGLMYEVDRFSWIGRMSDVDTVLGVWHTAPVSTIQDTKTTPLAVAVGGAMSGSYLYVIFLNALVGTNIQPVSGYSGKQSQLAMERGEVHGSFSILLNQMKAQHPEWFSENKLRVLVQVGTERKASLPDVPTLAELGTSDEDRRMLAVIASGDIIGRTLIGPPDMPAGRLAELRRAFDATMADPEVIAAATKMKLDLNPLSGAKLQDLMDEYKRLPAHLVGRIKQIVAEAKR